MKDKEKENANIGNGVPPSPPKPPPDAPEGPKAGQGKSPGTKTAQEESKENDAAGGDESTARMPEGTAQQPESAAKSDDDAQPPESAAKSDDDGKPPESAAPEPSPEPAPEELIAAARQEAEDNKDKFLRATAEMENFKRRIQKEHSESLRYAMSPLIRDIAATVDTLELAVSHAKKDPENGGQALVDGIEMVVKQIHEVFARFGVTRIDTAGKPFDPELHEAMTVVETADMAENQVIEEFQAGFKLHERVIRPARVSVSKAPA